MKRSFNNSNNYKAVLFDFDYTLADSSKGVCESVSYALSEMGYACPSFEKICRTIGLPLVEIFTVFTGNSEPNDAERFRKLFKEKADQVMKDGTVIFNEVEPLFEYFKLNGIKCGIVSTKNRSRIKDVLDRDCLNNSVDIIVGGEDVAAFKPDPEGLLMAIDNLNFKKADCLFVGDSLVDAKTAKNAGVDFIAVLTGTTESEEFGEYNPLHIIKRLDKLKDIT
jgi:phosphoglycolate phosphatase